MNNNRFKFRVWNIYFKHYEDERNVWLPPWGELYEDDGYYRPTNFAKNENFDPEGDNPFIFIENYIVEQCTGLKDKNGKLIYEGDIVADKNNKFFIAYSDEEACFTVNLIGNSSSIRTLGCSDYWLATKTIIGNIHENKDLLSITNTTKY